MNLETAIVTRRSVRQLAGPAPSNDEFAELLRMAAMAPDHGLLRPWRWILVRDRARLVLGESFVAEAPSERPDLIAAKALRAPLLATLVFQPQRRHKVPEWEQLAATCGMSHALMLLLHSRGYGSIWRTGAFPSLPRVHQVLGLRLDEQLLGWLYVGTPLPAGTTRPRLPEDMSDHLSTLEVDEASWAGIATP
jgi:nitroreductase